MNLEEELKKECKNYIRIESLVRQLIGNNLPRGIPAVPDTQEVQRHLNACRDYYEMYGSKLGYNSPWIVAYNDPNHFSQIEQQRRTKNGKP